MTLEITYDLGQLDRLARRLRELDDPDALAGLVEGLADVWLDAARARVGVDTGQLRARISLRSIAATASRAEALLEADTPYAGFHNYGNRYTPPNRFWNVGRDRAERRARELGGILTTEIRRSLVSGGSWNPRNLI